MAPSTKRPPKKYAVGDAVRLWADTRNKFCRKEYGVIVAYEWYSPAEWRPFGAWDCRVAFFGWRWNTPGKPYILRYFEDSLEPYVPTRKDCLTATR